MTRYPSDHDVSLRLNNTFIRYKGKCYLVKPVGKDTKISLFDITDPMWSKPTKKAEIVNANDKDVDVTSIELGFVQGLQKLYYVCRAPYRKQLQGIAFENILCRSLNENHFENVQAEVLYSENFIDMLEDRYPTYEKAHEMLGKPYTQVAFAKKLALTLHGPDKMHLYLNLTKIAEKKKTDNGWFLDQDYNTSTLAQYVSNKGVPLY